MGRLKINKRVVEDEDKYKRVVEMVGKGKTLFFKPINNDPIERTDPMNDVLVHIPPATQMQLSVGYYILASALRTAINLRRIIVPWSQFYKQFEFLTGERLVAREILRDPEKVEDHDGEKYADVTNRREIKKNCLLRFDYEFFSNIGVPIVRFLLMESEYKMIRIDRGLVLAELFYIGYVRQTFYDHMFPSIEKECNGKDDWPKIKKDWKTARELTPQQEKQDRESDLPKLPFGGFILSVEMFYRRIIVCAHDKFLNGDTLPLYQKVQGKMQLEKNKENKEKRERKRQREDEEEQNEDDENMDGDEEEEEEDDDDDGRVKIKKYQNKKKSGGVRGLPRP